MAITVVEDRDPVIVYKGQWSEAGDRFESGGTTMVTSEDGASFTIDFVGRNISIFGTIPVLEPGQSPTTATFRLDEGELAPVTFVGQHHPNETQYWIPLFRSPILAEDRPHTLVVTHEANRGGRLILDYASVQGTLARFALPGDTGSGGGLSETAKVAVVGGVLGGVILVLMGMIAALVMKQRKGRQGSVFRADGKALSPEHSGYYPGQSPMNTGSQHHGVGGLPSLPHDIQARGMTTSPPVTVHSGYTANHVGSPYRPPLPEMHES